MIQSKFAKLSEKHNILWDKLKKKIGQNETWYQQKGLLSRAVLFNLNFITMKNTFITSVIVASTTVQKYAKKQ